MKENGEETGNLKEEKLDDSQNKQENSSSPNSSEATSDEPVDTPPIENGMEDTSIATENNLSPSPEERLDASNEDTAENDDAQQEISDKKILDSVEKKEIPSKNESPISSDTEIKESEKPLDSNSELNEAQNDVLINSKTEDISDQKAETPDVIDKEIINTQEDPIAEVEEEKSKDSEQKEEEGERSHEEISAKEFHLDYTNYTKKQMVQVLESLLKEDDFLQIGAILKEIKRPFDEIAHAEKKAAYDKYIADGGEKDGFEFRTDELDQRFQKAYSNLKEKKYQHFNSLEKQKDNNLKIKLDILEKIRELVDSEETGVSIKSLKELQKQWKEVGAIPPSQVKSLWANFNALLDRFYDQRSIYFELKELDRKKNYDLKIELCEKVEQLSDGDDIREIIKQLNELHEEFKHIGPVPKEDQEVVWERFKVASDTIYSRRKDYYEKLKDELKINEVAKEALVEKLMPFGEFTSDRISDWNSKTKEILAVQKEWEAIGSVPKEKAKGINKHFWSSFKAFFNKKGHFFKKIEGERKENLKLKQVLVEKAVALKDSEDFRKTSDDLKQLQKQWKDIGPVPEKFRNEVFFQFKKACDHFFDRRRTNSGKLEQDYEENLKKKHLLCEELVKMSESEKVDIERVKSIETEWNEIGFVPKSNIKSIQKQYTDAIDHVIDKVDISESEKHKLRLSAQFNKMSYGPGAEKLLQKKEGALRRQISNLENDINLWQNNIDFFASSKNADKLKAEFKIKIEETNTQLKSLKEELKIISNI